MWRQIDEKLGEILSKPEKKKFFSHKHQNKFALKRICAPGATEIDRRKEAAIPGAFEDAASRKQY